MFDYLKSVNVNFVENYNSEFHYHPLIIPNWDNTSRMGWKGVVFRNSTPKNFRIHLKKVLGTLENKPDEQKIVFLKSWNEWAEGNYIEPDLQYGRAYLEVLKEEICG